TKQSRYMGVRQMYTEQFCCHAPCRDVTLSAVKEHSGHVPSKCKVILQAHAHGPFKEVTAMTRIIVVTVLAVGVTAIASADVTIKQTMTGKGLGLSGTSPGTTYIKGNKMRTDAMLGDKTQSTIFDIDAQKMYIFDSKKKEADVWDMAAFASEISKSV